VCCRYRRFSVRSWIRAWIKKKSNKKMANFNLFTDNTCNDQDVTIKNVPIDGTCIHIAALAENDECGSKNNTDICSIKINGNYNNKIATTIGYNSKDCSGEGILFPSLSKLDGTCMQLPEGMTSQLGSAVQVTCTN